MAETRISEAADLVDTPALEELYFPMKLMPTQYAIDNGSVADEGAVTWKERMFVFCRLRVTNNLDSEIKDRNCPWQQVTSGNFPGLTDLLDQMEIVYIKQRLDGGLVPAV